MDSFKKLTHGLTKVEMRDGTFAYVNPDDICCIVPVPSSYLNGNTVVEINTYSIMLKNGTAINDVKDHDAIAKNRGDIQIDGDA